MKIEPMTIIEFWDMMREGAYLEWKDLDEAEKNAITAEYNRRKIEGTLMPDPELEAIRKMAPEK
jgi:hypothetical protein